VAASQAAVAGGASGATAPAVSSTAAAAAALGGGSISGAPAKLFNGAMALVGMGALYTVYQKFVGGAPKTYQTIPTSSTF
jgi:hypothetical protein